MSDKADERERLLRGLTEEEEREDPELARLADAGDLRSLAARLAPAGQALPDPDRLYRGLGLDDAGLAAFLSNLASGRGVPSREAYSPEKLADFALTESLAHADGVRALFKDRTPEVEAALRRLESALVDLKCLFRAEVVARLAAEPELELRLFDRVVKSYLLAEIPPYLQSAVRGGADGAGSGCALFFAVLKGLKQGKYSVVVEFDRPASGVIDMKLPPGIYPAEIHEFVILGGIPGQAVRAVWIEGRRFTPQDFAPLAASCSASQEGFGEVALKVAHASSLTVKATARAREGRDRAAGTEV